MLLANAKKMNLTFRELNLFRVRDFIEFTDIYFAELEDKESVRQATQEDVDRLLM